MERRVLPHSAKRNPSEVLEQATRYLFGAQIAYRVSLSFRVRSTMPNHHNHRFEVGESYRDHRGTYKVISVEENRVVYDYGDGVQREGDAEIKWRIHANILLSEQHPPHTASSTQHPRAASSEQFWVYDEVAAIFVEVVTVYGKRDTDFMTHNKMVAAFMEHPEGKRILERPHDSRSNEYWVGVMLAWFSRTFTEGRSEWENRLERKKVGFAWAYRVRQKNT